MDRRQQRHLTDLEARLRRQERMNRRLASILGMAIEELEAEMSPGVRHGMPHTHFEYLTFCRLLDEQERHDGQ